MTGDSTAQRKGGRDARCCSLLHDDTVMIYYILFEGYSFDIQEEDSCLEYFTKEENGDLVSLLLRCLYFVIFYTI